jgi:hypothetical protein
MPFVLIFIGLSYWLNFVIRAWSVSGNIDNAGLVSSYTQSAILGLWITFFGGLWLYLRKR